MIILVKIGKFILLKNCILKKNKFKELGKKINSPV